MKEFTEIKSDRKNYISVEEKEKPGWKTGKITEQLQKEIKKENKKNEPKLGRILWTIWEWTERERERVGVEIKENWKQN